jgi:hypothetical protein
MSAKLWCKFGDGIEQNYPYATDEEARQALESALDHHRADSHLVAEQARKNEEPLYIVTRGDGRILRTYQLIPAYSEVS